MSTPPRPAGLLGDLAGPDVRSTMTDSRVVLQPIGAFEHHGPHLPLYTDSLVVDAVASAVVADAPGLEVSLLPTLSYGLSSEHVWAPGTVTLSVPTLLAVLDDVAAATVRAGAKRLAFLNGHGGNTHLLRVACREIRAKHGLMTFLVHPSLPPDNGGPPTDAREEGLGIHGGLGETSVVRYLRPDLVDMTKAERSVPSWVHEYEWVGMGGAAEFAWLSNDLAPSGVAGDPTLATVEAGKVRFEAAVTAVTAALAEISTFRFPGT
jgi:creatinine amidohydrolase